MENIVPQESGAVSPIPDEKFRGPLLLLLLYTVFSIFRSFICALSDAFSMLPMPRNFPISGADSWVILMTPSPTKSG